MRLDEACSGTADVFSVLLHDLCSSGEHWEHQTRFQVVQVCRAAQNWTELDKQRV